VRRGARIHRVGERFRFQVSPESQRVLSELIGRIDLGQLPARMNSECRVQIDLYRNLSAASEQSMLEASRRNLYVVIRWLTTGLPPADDDLAHFQATARERADEGIPLEAFLTAYRVTGRVAWQALLEEAVSGEREALLEVATIAMEYLNAVTAAVRHAYLEQRDQLVSEAERKSRTALTALARGSALSSEEHDLCRQLGLPVEDEYTCHLRR
jgi:hypothetical protein